MAWPAGARKWTLKEISRDAHAAAEAFCERRLGEPKERYLRAFDLLESANRELLGSLSKLQKKPVDRVWLANALANENLRIALRYLGAPPVSEDDLKTLSGDSLAPTLVRATQERANSIANVIVQILDPRRFPWMYENRDPSPEEIERAILASTVVAATQRVQTSRRIDERIAVEGAVRGLLVGMGWREKTAPQGGIKSIRKDAPAAGEFMTSVKLGRNGADFVIGLYDHRLVAVECKGSNSEINSRKRVNKEVANDAQAWLREFGEETVVPAAAIQGVFKPAYIAEAQEIPVVFFWGHRLDDLKKFLEVTRRLTR
jgi:hypothetical protein